MKFDEKVKEEISRTGLEPVKVCKQVLISKLNQILDMGYRDEIDKRYWDLVQRDYLNQLKNINKIPENPAVTSVKVISRGMDQERLESAKNTLKNEIEAMDIQLSVLKAFNKWRFISNSIEYYM